MTKEKRALTSLQTALEAITECTRALLRATGEKQLLERICTVVVESGYRFCWVGEAEQNAEKNVRPLAWAGVEEGYLSAVKIRWSDSEHGHGPTGTSIRTGKPVIFNDSLHDPRFSPWRPAAAKRGYRSMCALPLMAGGAPFGALSIYASQPAAFGEHETQLLMSLAEMLAFGIVNLRERQQTRDTLHEVTELNEQVIQGAYEGIVVCDQDLRCVLWNPFMEKLSGIPARQMIGRSPFEVFPFLRELGVEGRVRRALAGELVIGSDVPFKPPQGADTVWLSGRYAPVREPSGQVSKAIVVLRDVTERKRAEEQLRTSEERLSLVIQGSNDGIWDWNMATHEHYTSARWKEILGYGEGELPEKDSSFFDRLHPDDRARVTEGLNRHLEHREPFSLEIRMRHKDGQYRWLLTRGEAVRDTAGHPVRMVGSLTDISERKNAEEALRHSEQRLQQAVRASLIGIFEHNHLTDVIYWSPRQREIYGFTPDEEVNLAKYFTLVYPEDRERIMEAVQRAHDPSGDGLFDVEHRITRRDGQLRWLTTRSQTMFEGQGPGRHKVLTCGAVVDVTESKQAEKALHDAEARFRGLVEQSLVGIYIIREDGRISYSNPQMEQIFGYTTEELSRMTPLDLTIDEDKPRALATINDLLEGRAQADRPFRCRRKDRTLIDVEVRGKPTEVDGKRSVIGTVLDVTERKRLEAQYQQAQKMEAVGRLAGGIAHDFNNILGIILGYSEFAFERLEPAHAVRRDITQIKLAADKAAGLTRQLLAFSRQQVVHFSILDINKVIKGSVEMLKRVVGEDVAISFKRGDSLGLVKADPGQIEQILMNLAVNSRDAMPRGGTITIETGNRSLEEGYAGHHPNVVAGPYVMLSFSDTGSGIDQENLDRIFEPFFTTKDPGKGTGLGLATVYGIVKQSQGYVWAKSEVGKGTSFNIFLPRVEERESTIATESAGENPGGSETILLVEDDAALREVAAHLLQAAGYTVVKAETPHAALAMVQGNAKKIDLLLTDVIMPGMSGVDLYTHLRPLRPEAKLIYVSGYAGEQLRHYGQVESEAAFLEKPYTKNALLKKVRSVLDT